MLNPRFKDLKTPVLPRLIAPIVDVEDKSMDDKYQRVHLYTYTIIGNTF